MSPIPPGLDDLDGVTVHDTHSPRGVYVNDNRVAGQAPLRDRDILWLGAPGDESSVMIECRVASATATPESGTTYSGDANALADLVDVELDRISQPDGPAAATPAEPAGSDALADLCGDSSEPPGGAHGSPVAGDADPRLADGGPAQREPTATARFYAMRRERRRPRRTQSGAAPPRDCSWRTLSGRDGRTAARAAVARPRADDEGSVSQDEPSCGHGSCGGDPAPGP